MGRRIDIEPDDVAQLGGELRVGGQLELAHPMRLQAMGAPDALHRGDADRRRPWPSSPAVQWVVSPGGSARVSAITRSATSGAKGGMREGRVLSRSSPSTPSCMNRSCQRHTQVLALPVRRMISAVPRPSARQQHDPCPPDMLLRAVPVCNDRFQTNAIGGCSPQRRHPCASPRLAPSASPGNPLSDSSVRFCPLASNQGKTNPILEEEILVTGIRIRFFQTSDFSNYLPLLRLTEKTCMRFCEINSIPYFQTIGLYHGTSPWHAIFNRIPYLYELMCTGFDGWSIYCDADGYVNDLDFPIYEFLRDNADKALIVAAGGSEQRARVNDGVFLLNFGSHWVGKLSIFGMPHSLTL